MIHVGPNLDDVLNHYNDINEHEIGQNAWNVFNATDNFSFFDRSWKLLCTHMWWKSKRKKKHKVTWIEFSVFYQWSYYIDFWRIEYIRETVYQIYWTFVGKKTLLMWFYIFAVIDAVCYVTSTTKAEVYKYFREIAHIFYSYNVCKISICVHIFSLVYWIPISSSFFINVPTMHQFFLWRNSESECAYVWICSSTSDMQQHQFI